ncbi:MAG: sulfate transporter [Ramlibacter sp.]|nr:sulfate transporter [Ramlibacter sp.]
MATTPVAVRVIALLRGASLGDLRGGIVSAAVAIPLAMGYGMFAFVALGEDYFGHGVLAGLWSAVIVGMVCVATGNDSPTVYAPRITTTFYLGSVLYALAQSPLPQLREGGVTMVLAVFFAIVFLGGVFQALFGLVRLGTLIKFTPHPVMAGFQNAAALLLLLVQISSLAGMDASVPFMQAANHLQDVKPLSLLVVAVTVAVTWNAKRFVPRIPPVLLGLAVGALAWWGLALLGLRPLLGPLIGPLPERPLEPMSGAAVAMLLPSSGMPVMATLMVSAALGLAFIASMDALLCERILAGSAETPRDSDRQLVRLGLGNMVAALCGGITSGVNLGASNLSRAEGSRRAVSVVVNAGVILLTLLFFLPLLQQLPRAVLSAVIAVIAIQHFDPWTVRLVRRMAAQPLAARAGLLRELAVVLTVALLSVFVNIVVAVFIGVLIAAALFLLRMSRSVVRRRYHCDEVRSNQLRDARLMALLAQHGRRIVVFELEGPIFFGSAEGLAQDVRGAIDAQTFAVILDFRRVNDIDSTGAEVLLQLYNRLVLAPGLALFSGLQHRPQVARLMDDLGLLAAIAPSAQFADVDRALEAAEDALLESLPDRSPLEAVPFEALDLLRDLHPDERIAVRGFLSQRQFATGETVFHQGDPGTELFVITHGRASVRLDPAGAAPMRLATFAAGTTFGELAILDHRPRSATVVADGPMTCLVLSEASFSAMQASEPDIAIRLLVNLGRELSLRMRRANQMLHQMGA